MSGRVLIGLAIGHGKRQALDLVDAGQKSNDVFVLVIVLVEELR